MTHPKATVLLTRPRAQAERYAATLGANLPVVISPILTIVPRAQAVDLTNYAGVILTSENAARVLAELVDVAKVRAWCVGDRTTLVAADLGMDAVSAVGDASDLVEMLLMQRPEGALLHAHGAETRGNVAQQLAAEGIPVMTKVIYDQVETPLSDQARAVLAGSDPVVLPLFSPRSARLVGDAAQGANAPLVIVALSPAVMRAWTGPKPESFTVADHPDAAHMTKAIATIWTGLSA